MVRHAQNRWDNRPAAVKVLPKHDAWGRKEVTLIEREVDIMGEVDHVHFSVLKSSLARSLARARSLSLAVSLSLSRSRSLSRARSLSISLFLSLSLSLFSLSLSLALSLPLPLSLSPSR